MKHRIVLTAGLLCTLATLAHAKIEMPKVFSDHMVLQRNRTVPVWGTAKAGQKVTVQFREQKLTTTTDKSGKWMVKLEPLKEGGPDQLTIHGENKIVIKDVLVGEVWLGSGQSNMAGRVNGYMRNDKVLAMLASKSYPKLRMMHSRGKWTVSNAKTNLSYSALLFAFGARLQQKLGMPVGLIVGAVGGTPSGRWLTEKMLLDDNACRKLILSYREKYDYEAEMKRYRITLMKWERAVALAKKRGRRAPRKPLMPTKEASLIRSGKVGDLFEAHIRPIIPFSIRGVLWDQGESGTALNGIDQFHTMGALISGWRKEWDQSLFPFLYIQKPSGGGCAWSYDDPVTQMADAYSKLPAKAPGHRDGLYRELHTRIMWHPRTYMVQTSDLGSGVHPRNKSGYGHRAATLALGKVYGHDLYYFGPKYRSHSIEKGRFHIKFYHATKGLAWKHGECLEGFMIAGKDRVFHWAEAKIEDDTVIVWSSKVPHPVAVRYGWAQRRSWANLFNKIGLPALTFRTDDW